MLNCIVSILKNKKKNTSYHFHILHSGLNPDNTKLLSKFASKKNSDISFFNVSEYLKNINLDDYMRIDENYTYITGETFYRFFMPSIFTQYDKVIYLDCDTVVTQDLTELFDIDLTGFYLGGVRDLYVMSQAEHLHDWNIPTVSTNQTFDVYLKEVLNIQDLKYFNAGILLFNLKEMRQDNIEQKLLDFAQNNLHLEYQDQDILNSVCSGRIKQIPFKYNITNFPQHSKDLKVYSPEIQKEFKSKPAIIHYTGKFKPWTLSEFCVEARIKRLAFWWGYYIFNPLFYISEIFIYFNNLIINLRISLSFNNLKFNFIIVFIKKIYNFFKRLINRIVKTIFKHIKRIFKKIFKTIFKHLKRFFNKIIKTAIKHTKRIFNNQEHN